jgi:hypothetical protein
MEGRHLLHRPHPLVSAVAMTTMTTSGEIEKRATLGGRSVKRESGELRLGLTPVARTHTGC